MSEDEVPEQEVQQAYEKLDRDAKQGGYHLNPDVEFTKELISGLLVNEKRYGYGACPCRLADGVREQDLDIICPCDYRDPDLNEYGACYCALYVSQEVIDGTRELSYIPDRRPTPEEREQLEKASKPAITIEGGFTLPYPIWRCKVCGYLCARDEPPLVCPICKAKKDRFERLI